MSWALGYIATSADMKSTVYCLNELTTLQKLEQMDSIAQEVAIARMLGEVFPYKFVLKSLNEMIDDQS